MVVSSLRRSFLETTIQLNTNDDNDDDNDSDDNNSNNNDKLKIIQVLNGVFKSLGRKVNGFKTKIIF